MADIKFHCPECRQRIAVDQSAASMQVDCPNCRSTLIIPTVSEVVPEITVRRRLVAAGGGANTAYEELDRKQKELALALQEAAKWRADTERSKAEVIKLREDLAVAAREREGLRASGAEIARLKSETGSFKVHLEQTQHELASARAEREKLARELAKRGREPEMGSMNLGPGHSALQERLIAGERERSELKAQLTEALEKGGDLQLREQLAKAQQQIEAERAKAAQSIEQLAAASRSPPRWNDNFWKRREE